MNIQQLEYILAVDTYRHFAKAAEHCRVTQPTLSMMIQKLESGRIATFDDYWKTNLALNYSTGICSRSALPPPDVR